MSKAFCVERAPTMTDQPQQHGVGGVDMEATKHRVVALLGPTDADPLLRMLNSVERLRAEVAQLTEIAHLKAYECDRLRARCASLEAALRQIQVWDCLNPPDPKMCVDHPWLRRLVDAALDEHATTTQDWGTHG